VCVPYNMRKVHVEIRQGCRHMSPSGRSIVRRGAERSGVAAGVRVRPVRPIVRRSAVGCFYSCWWWAGGVMCRIFRRVPLLCCAVDVVLGTCGGGPNGQERCVVGGRLLTFGCLGSRSPKMSWVTRWSCRRVSPSWAVCRPEKRGFFNLVPLAMVLKRAIGLAEVERDRESAMRVG